VSLTEIAVIAAGLILGYWAVSKLFSDGPAATPSSTEPAGPAGTNSSAGGDAAAANAAAQPAWAAILNVSADATSDEIRAAYEALLAKVQPDQLNALGADFRDLAERKSRELTQAYREAMQARGVEP
jgi:alkanesulfonate monooxygenase SsuD/methylene tetrahydromethanopterin reductase-like flavin-dependent oxidoreductase (luciferase family)